MARVRMSETKSKILHLLSEVRDPLRAMEIVKRTNLNSSSVHKALRQLRDQDLITCKHGCHPEINLWVRFYFINFDVLL